ncbi:MAG: alpha amylase C-terminal domain-containing protein [Bacteroidales bacterium]|jgi:1,4-alpha-glucan branching enzyme|nr:alpha amylase C-terminal domain-containing protein [Bacteroidales bacterium]
MKPLTLPLIKNDPSLKPYERTIQARLRRTLVKALDFTHGNKKLSDCFNGHLYYGLHQIETGWVFREWAPNATNIWLVGDFSDWQRKDEFRLNQTENGNWEIELPKNAMKHGDLYKLYIEWNDSSGERLPTHVRRVVQDEKSKIFCAQVWSPTPYKWKHKPLPKKIESPLIYEVHVGMSGEKATISTYNEFRKNVLPRIADLDYNVIQIMAIQEHPYYGSFGYQVSNFFAVSSRFGTPEDLKALIDAAHELNIAVVLDVVHSHAVKNELEGLAKFDGTSTQFFYEGERGDHPIWDSKCFNYGKNEVIAFLLSNLKYWLEEFRFDGFRFDGVTSMIYWHHGLGTAFTNYSMYFDGAQDEDALTYLALANQVVHEINPNAITIAEDVSGYPGLAAVLNDGGIGFDFRMNMGIADYWIRIIKEKTDEQWHVGDLYHELTNKRDDEKTISYAESHDQAMVGDKTIIFRLLDKEMYTSMSVSTPSLLVDRGIALHKIIRLISLATAGNGYLNFMGNEFGHPEWIDFPREGNDWSYHYARRQWSLSDNKLLRYHFLKEFDKAMIRLIKQHDFFDFKPFAIIQNISDQVLIFKRGELLFVFNFNPEKSFTDYGFQIDEGSYKILLCSDDTQFGGQNRIDTNLEYFTNRENGKAMLKLYVPNRVGMVLKRM